MVCALLVPFVAIGEGSAGIPLVFAGILSWVIGFAIVVVPGGIGVREAAFTAIASIVSRTLA